MIQAGKNELVGGLGGGTTAFLWKTFIVYYYYMFIHFVLYCPTTLVEGDYNNGLVHPSVRPSIRPSVRPSVDTILSPQLLLQFSRDFDETFQLLFA